MDRKFSPKDRVLKAINLKEPDQVPIFITITPQVAERLAISGNSRIYPSRFTTRRESNFYTELLVHLGNDIVGIGACAPTASNPENRKRYSDQ